MTGDMALVAFLVASPFALAASYYDLSTMEIPHWVAPAAAAAFTAVVFAGLPFDEALWRVIGGFIVLAIGFLLFAAGVAGGGDVKLAAAFAILIAPVDATVVLILLSVTALASLFVIVGLRKTIMSGGGTWRVWNEQKSIPYAVPMAMTLVIYLALAAFLVN